MLLRNNLSQSRRWTWLIETKRAHRQGELDGEGEEEGEVDEIENESEVQIFRDKVSVAKPITNFNIWK